MLIPPRMKDSIPSKKRNGGMKDPQPEAWLLSGKTPVSYLSQAGCLQLGLPRVAYLPISSQKEHQMACQK